MGRLRLRLSMITQLKKLMIMVTFLSHTSTAQYRHWNHRTSYQVPLAEPEPEPEPMRTFLSHISFAKPEPGSTRLSRRLITRQRLAQNLLRSTTASPVVAATQRSSTSTETSFIQRRTNLLRLLQSSFPNASPAEDLQINGKVQSNSSINNTWHIDTAQFEIVPAVPVQEEETAEFTETDLVTNSLVLNQFSAVPAVPEATTASLDKLIRQPKNAKELLEEVDNNITENIFNEKCSEKCFKYFCASNS